MEAKIFISDEAIYKYYDVFVKKTKYVVTVVSGRFNYISIRKVTANPFGLVGKQFENFEDAINNYKNKKIKEILTNIKNNI